MVRIGQKIQFRPAFWTKAEVRPIVTGTIVWIHPQSRYVVVEYRVLTPFGAQSALMRECIHVGRGE